MFKLENSIKNWLKQFQKQKAFDEGTIQEMELHLRDHIEDLLNQGYTEKAAFNKAVESFGEVPKMANEEYKIIKRKTSIRTILFATMINNFFKTSTRNLLKNPLTTFINILGLAVAIGACMVTYAFVDFDLSIDRFHENKDELYLSTYYVNREGVEERYGNSPAPLASRLKADFPSIKNITQVYDGRAIVKYGDNVFHESIRYVDPSFLEMFTFPLKWGISESLKDVNSVILSEEYAKKYFGDQNPLGAEIKLIIDESTSKNFKVSGVAKEFPEARIIDFSVLININNLDHFYPEHDNSDWKHLVNATFIQVAEKDAIPTIAQEMDKYKAAQNKAEPDWPISSFGFVNLHDLHLASDEIKNDISYDATDEGRIGIPVTALFILLLACFNYLNIAIVSAAKRLKEIGMRKVIGASKGLIIFQFLSENLFMTFIAGILGLILAATIFLPWFASFAPLSDTFNLLDPNLWTFLVAILFTTGILSGLYPAFYISRFPSVQIFKGTLKFGKKNFITKLFLTAQLILTCVGIAYAIMFAQNSTYQSKREWGYNQKQVLYAQVRNGGDYKKLESSLEQAPFVMSISGSEDHLSIKKSTTVLQFPDKKVEVAELSVDANYMNTTGLELIDGRFFYENAKDDASSIVVTELFLKNLAISDPYSLSFKIDSVSYRIIGVIKDFHFNNFYYPQNTPVIFTLAKALDYQFLSMKVENGTQLEGHKLLKEKWATLFPEIPFNGGFQEDTWIDFYQDLEVQQMFTKYIAILFVILASLGMYGLIQLNIAGRIREFSIRKTLGANGLSLAMNLSKQYLPFFAAAIIVGVPFGHFINMAMLEMMYPNTSPYGYVGAITAGLILVVVLIAVISTQVRRIVRINPVAGLKVE